MEQKEGTINLLDFHKIGKNGPYDIIDDKIANYIIEHENIIIIAGKPYIYKNGLYKKDTDGNILRYLIKSMIIQEVITITRVNRVYNLILSNHKLMTDIDDINRHPRHWINFKNGMLDTLEMVLHKHNPKYLSINQIPFDYNQVSEKESVVVEFLNGIMPDEDDRKMFLEFIGYCMTTDTGLQKFLVINGVGGTGKSTIVRLVNNVIGKENISNLSLQDLNQRFDATNLFGKILNSCADIPSKAMEQVDIIKKITGEDRIKGEYKGGAVFFFNNYAKLLFSANEIPISLDDKTNAYYRRFLIININKRCHEIKNLEQRLNEEIHIFISIVVNAVHEMYKRGSITESQGSKDAILELYKASDGVQAFIIDELEISATGKTDRTKLYKWYEDYCLENGRSPITSNGFYKNLRNKGYAECKVNGIRYFKGLICKDTDFENAQNSIFDN
ncbi:MAG: phage/plasmid primase, family, C-terminal domain protein [Anaerocolumna sp.]|jgi:P4 family phage/plasmid primase-like protien|nr:phage/plasmid primase, family, C-terminal domain protein [Anaerocolumna sp.]